MDSNLILNFISGIVVLILLLIIGFNVKNKKVRYNSIRCLKNEKALLEEKLIETYKEKGINFDDESLYKENNEKIINKEFKSPIFICIPCNFSHKLLYSLSGSIIYCFIPINLYLNINNFV